MSTTYQRPELPYGAQPAPPRHRHGAVPRAMADAQRVHDRRHGTVRVKTARASVLLCVAAVLADVPVGTFWAQSVSIEVNSGESQMM